MKDHEKRELISELVGIARNLRHVMAAFELADT